MVKEILKKIEPEQKKGLVVVLTGDGKGKTTSALGMALRATGHGLRICIIQFMKGDIYAGEIDGVKKLGPNVELHLTGTGFCGIMEDTHTFEEHRKSAQDAIKLAGEKTRSGDYDMVILDEINNAIRLGLVDLRQATLLIEKKPPLTHMVLTGRNAHEEIVRMADTVSEVREVKHAYWRGIEPQPGIDY